MIDNMVSNLMFESVEYWELKAKSVVFADNISFFRKFNGYCVIKWDDKWAIQNGNALSLTKYWLSLMLFEGCDHLFKI